MKFHHIIAAFCIATMGTVHAAESYPSKPVNVIVGFGPGGINDIVARVVSKELESRLGQSFIINNRAGAGGTIGADVVANAAPDGYTLLLGSVSNVVMAPLVYPHVPYDSAKSFIPIALVGGSPNVLVVQDESPIRSLKDLIETAKGKPGQVGYGSAGVGTSNHLTVELFQEAAGVELMHVPYKGDSQALLGLVGGETQFMFATLPAAMPHISSGRLRPIAVASPERSALVPDVPTVAEAGIKDFSVNVWVGFLAPAGTPQPIIDKLSHEILEITKMDAVKEKLTTLAVELSPMESAEFRAAIESDVTTWGPAAKAAAAAMPS